MRVPSNARSSRSHFERIGLRALALLEEERIKNAKAHLEGVRDAEGVIAGFGGFGALEIFLHCFAKEGDPTLEVLFLDRENRVFGERFATVRHAAEEQGAPKSIHGRQMMVPIHFGNVVKNRA